jgi:DNA-binding XRE family transcriptional regulator
MSLKETKKRLMANPVTAARIGVEVAKAHQAVALADLRAGVVTQADVAQILGVSQRRVCAIENAQDVYLSTLRSYVETLGYTLEITAEREGERIPLRIGQS